MEQLTWDQTRGQANQLFKTYLDSAISRMDQRHTQIGYIWHMLSRRRCCDRYWLRSSTPVSYELSLLIL